MPTFSDKAFFFFGGTGSFPTLKQSQQENRKQPHTIEIHLCSFLSLIRKQANKTDLGFILYLILFGKRSWSRSKQPTVAVELNITIIDSQTNTHYRDWFFQNGHLKVA